LLWLSCILANEPAHHTLNLDPFLRLDKNRLELLVSRLKPNKLGLAVKLLHGGRVAIDQRAGHLTVFSSFLCRDDDAVTVLNVLVDHRLSTHTHSKRAPMSLQI